MVFDFNKNQDFNPHHTRAKQICEQDMMLKFILDLNYKQKNFRIAYSVNTHTRINKNFLTLGGIKMLTFLECT